MRAEAAAAQAAAEEAARVAALRFEAARCIQSLFRRRKAARVVARLREGVSVKDYGAADFFAVRFRRCHVTPRHATSRYATFVTPCHASPCHATPCHAMSRHVTPRLTRQRHGTDSCAARVASCRTCHLTHCISVWSRPPPPLARPPLLRALSALLFQLPFVSLTVAEGVRVRLLLQVGLMLSKPEIVWLTKPLARCCRSVLFKPEIVWLTKPLTRCCRSA